MTDPRDEPSDMAVDVDPVDWLRRHPEDWIFVTAEDVLTVDPFVRRTFERASARRASLAEARRRRRRRWLRGGVAGLIGLSVTTAGALAFVASRHDSRPEAGVTCWSAPSAEANAVVIEATDDPLGGCTQVWLHGDLPDPSHPDPAATAPTLVACVGARGGFEVFPGGGGDVCGAMSMTPADPGPAPELAAIDTLVDEISVLNGSGPCLSRETVTSASAAAVKRSGLHGWSVDQQPGFDDKHCFVGAVDSAAKTVSITAID